MNRLEFTEISPAGRLLRDWWEGLERNPGDRAALRRCARLVDVVAVPAFHDLRWQLDTLAREHDFRFDPERLLAVVALAARLRENRPGELPRQMAGGESGEPVVSELRFRRLLQCPTRQDLFTPLRRALGLLNDNAGLLSLAHSVYWWGEPVRKQWSYAYFGELHKRSAASSR